MIKKVVIIEDDRGLREQLAQIFGAARHFAAFAPAYFIRME